MFLLAPPQFPLDPLPERELPVIDVHAHVFNASYLPLEGILLNLSNGHQPMVARALARFIQDNTRMAELDDEDVHHPTWSMLRTGDEDVGGLARLIASRDDALPGYDPDLRSALAEFRDSHLAMLDKRNRLVALWPQVEPALSTAAPLRARLIGKDFLEQQEQAELLWNEFETTLSGPDLDPLAVLQFTDPGARLPPKSVSLAGLLEGFAESLGEGKQFLAWLELLMLDEPAVLERHALDHPEVRFLVHHMMDLEMTYGSKAAIAWERSIERMRELVRKSEGRMGLFVAWDPLRGEEGLRILRAAFESGGVLGVKIYPPSGYSPDDPRNEPLYAFCVNRDIPLFAHCTPHGFEHEKGDGRYSDPANWQPVLRKHPGLRLCLGHAGGAEWFASMELDFRLSFAWRAVQLCLDYENVYLDFAYLEEVLASGQRGVLAKRLERVLEGGLDRAGKAVLARRLMFGTDWHMSYRVLDQKQFVECFRELFSGPLEAHRADFFCRNAVRYLGLPRYVDTQRDWLGPLAVARLEELIRW